MNTAFSRFVPAAALLAALASPAAAQVRGEVEIDGSSTVGPITSAVQGEFLNEYPDVDVTVNVSGTGGGFKRFVRGETDISNASRPIKAKEAAEAEANGIGFVEVPVAYDGLSIVVNQRNDWATDLTVEDLQKIFLAENQSEVTRWKDVNPDYPDVPLSMYIPGTDSGTFDYFKEVVAGDDGQIRSDVSPSENDNDLVRGIVGNQGAIGFFGSSYYFENRDKLRAIKIQNADGDSVGPTQETIEDGSYNPFSRPLFIYVKASSMDKPAVREFVNFYLDVAPDVAEAVGYVRLPGGVYDNARARVRNRVTGTVMADHGVSIVDAYTAE